MGSCLSVEEKKIKITDQSLALEKMRGWCAYQERCQQEVRDKLYDLGLWTNAVEEIISALIAENYINEERFAKAFVSGKFRIKKWGRLKIKMALKQKRVSDYSITVAMKEMDESVYTDNLKKLLDSKSKTLKSEKNAITKKYKLVKFAQSKGYETDIILDQLKTTTTGE